jgi:hypothetical protein
MGEKLGTQDFSRLKKGDSAILVNQILGGSEIEERNSI